MTNEEFIKSLDSALDGIVDEIRDIAIRKWDCGGVDKEAYYEDNFTPVRACIASAMRTMEIDLVTIGEHRKLFENLNRF